MTMTKMFYEGHDREHGVKSVFVFTVNGKGDWGNEEYWTDEEWDIATDLGNFISQEANTTTPIYEGDVVWIVCDREWDIMGWKEDVQEAYRVWKAERLPLFDQGESK